MTRKKKDASSSVGQDAGNDGATDGRVANNAQPKSATLAAAEPQAPPTLVICRNKHWRYISSYHGPWLNLPPEVLESLAYSNYYSPRPQPIDPAVFFDLVKIRRLIDDATSLAVRAVNGTTSSALSNSLSATNGILSGSDAEILGIGSSRGGGNAKLSRERKHRMREHATQKLSHAYRLDEIAASVSTMQSASALEDVAKIVLQREEADPDAQYVHFFHEKIPSRALAASTTLDTLNSIIRQMPTEASTYRTRAVTRIFKDDFPGAIKDLTDGLAVFRLYHPQHQNQQPDIILAKDAAKISRDYGREAKVSEKDQPSSLEPQFLFHRGNTYLAMACEYIAAALRGQPPRDASSKPADDDAAEKPKLDPQEREEARARAEARKYVRTYAKRALRDYLAFLSHFDYTPGLSAEYTEAFLQRVSAASNASGNRSRAERLLDIDAHSQSGASDALVRYEGQQQQSNGSLPEIPKPRIHKLNSLFAAVAPADLPPYPADSENPAQKPHPIFNLPDFSEAVTYHPLLTDVLHSLLLCHCLIQTSAKEHLRHAYMAARIARVCDGYPIFLAARSPSRADWIEIIRRSGNFLNLESTWEKLCAPAPLPGQQNKQKAETPEQKKERIKRQAIEGALGDERVVDEDSFRKSVRAREMMAAREEEELQRQEYNRTTSVSPPPVKTGADTNGSHAAKEHAPKRWAQGEDGKEYPITTERAEAIVRWVREAPPPSSGVGEGGGKKKGKAGSKGRIKKTASQATSLNGGDAATGLERSVESLDVE
ncbi:uncharacterized protein HMPREF1541_08590 [Cyphellophora europaea CBS 101466]|uniref:Uncharacterized protein n=1 Tax=Cyphellophora europaea (strain CBS 101466) TaxID=1220924 RepID=W2RKS4_CYPE1|nr:uncharacterized protein HMPREF1541_08590 [Cyphellophora europaea CBS 101466]ETN36313.1 hypothetical protein HMPREF1541_08590 [Cyphellophora europaea CBS 101466]